MKNALNIFLLTNYFAIRNSYFVIICIFAKN